MTKAEKAKMLRDLYVGLVTSIRVNAPINTRASLAVHKEALQEAKLLMSMFEKEDV